MSNYDIIDDLNKSCKDCGITKVKADAFYVRVSNRDGYDHRCKDCYREQRSGRKTELAKTHKPRTEVLLEQVLQKLNGIEEILELNGTVSKLTRPSTA